MRTTAALAALLVAAASVASGMPPVSGAPAPSGTHSVPPPAPKRTDSGNSPAAPDPHPRRGGIGPHGDPVGGRRLLGRGLVLPRHARPLPAHLTARAWIVVDLDSGDVLGARDPHGRYQPASIQKLLTTVTLLPLLPGKRQVRVSRRAATTEGSHAGLVPGGHYTIDQLFAGLLLVSGNDAAEALAEAAGGRHRTVAMMNRTALALGGYDTYVQTPSGLDGWKQLTSAYDMALFLRAALTQRRFVRYDTTPKATLPKQRIDDFGPIELYNQNELFLSTVKGALAAKTGFTDAAQHTFAGAIEKHGHRYGVVLLRAQRWPDDQWQQATKLVRWAVSLPRGTKPVGHLAGPIGPPPTELQRSSVARAAGLPATLGPSGGGGSAAAWWSVPALVAAAVAVLIALRYRRGRRVRP